MLTAEGIRKIAIVRLSSFGDVVMALGALENLRASFPDAHIAWIVDSKARNVLEKHPALDEIIDFPGRRWKEALRSLRSLPAVVRESRAFRRELAARNFDLAIDFQGNLKSGMVTRATRARIRLGYGKDQCREPNTWFTNRTVSFDGLEVHRMDRDRLLLSGIGVPFVVRPARIALDAADTAVADALYRDRPEGERTVLLHPGTSAFMPHKRWPARHYAHLARLLLDRGNTRVLWSWGPGDEEVLDSIAREGKSPLALLPPTPSQKSLAAVLLRAGLVIGSDTGPVHLASALGAPVIALLGPGDPRHYYPHGRPERALFRKPACSPCRHRTCATRECMEDIHPEAVFRRALAVLDGA